MGFRAISQSYAIIYQVQMQFQPRIRWIRMSLIATVLYIYIDRAASETQTGYYAE